ncbi:MAG TPA: MlaD family protein [Puia sp.]|jgi:phospholipid/cholesterol/gamma-HCH transport system substrate-binding protein|nr:MlaD family protein [Puia sp.]
MNEVKTGKRLAVGIFISLGLAILLVTIFTIGNQRKSFIRSIRLHVVFDNVQGLQPGNNIWLSGMKVGTVKAVDFYGNSQVVVTLDVEQKAQPHIRKDSKAHISTDGLVGNKIVVIDGGSNAAPIVSNNDSLPSEHIAGTQEMMSTFQASNSNLLEITGNLKTISHRLTEGQGTLGRLINDPDIADHLRSSIDHLRNATAGSEKMIANLEAFSDRLRQPDGLASKLATDTTVFTQIKGAIAQLNQAAAQVDTFSRTLRAAGEGLQNTNSPVGVVLHDPDAAADLQRMLKNLRVSSKELSDDLEAVQHNFLLRGFFRKKAKTDQ